MIATEAYDEPLLDQAFALALMGAAKPLPTAANCDLCASGRRCLVHREPQDWPQPGRTP